jgi:hypothetical protein
MYITVCCVPPLQVVSFDTIQVQESRQHDILIMLLGIFQALALKALGTLSYHISV